MRFHFRTHPRSGVRDRQHHVVARFQFRGTAHTVLVERDVRGFQREFAAAGHGIARVDGQVHDDLFNLSGIRPHRLQAGSRDDPRIHVLAHEMLKHAFHVRDDLVEIEGFRL